jgi:transketolase
MNENIEKNKLILASELLIDGVQMSQEEFDIIERLFITYRALVIMLYNYVQSGHPGGSISCGRIIFNLLLNDNSKFDITDLNRKDSDVIGFAAGHKALGLYSFLAVIFEIVKLKDKKLYYSIKDKIRLEDLLGFRKNPATILPLMKKFNSRRLDGHPTPETPGVVLATGASGVGFGAFGGYAFAKKEYYENPPIINIIEGEGGMTPGRVHENLAHFWASKIWNLVIHIDWNNASIDSDNVCTDLDCKTDGEYVNWTPYQLGLLHGYHTVYVENGRNNNYIKVAQDYVFNKTIIQKNNPSMIVYKTLKGECYLEGKKSHGSGYKFESEGYFKSQEIFENTYNIKFFRAPTDADAILKEEYLYKNLYVIEEALRNDPKLVDFVFNKLIASKNRLDNDRRTKKDNAANITILWDKKVVDSKNIPQQVYVKPGSSVTLREVLGKTISYLNHITKGGFYGFAADLVGSTSLNLICDGFPEGFISSKNPLAKILPTGICEDGGASLITGISASGHYIGVGSSYATFMGPMSFTAARLYTIAFQAKHGKDMMPVILINAHAGLKTGEDGPTHACPQTLSMWKSFNKLKWKVITLTPWDPNEIWPLIVAAIKHKPAIIVPFVTRPTEIVPDREKLNFPKVTETINGIYYIHKAKKSKKTVIYQGAEVGIELPKVVEQLDKEKIDVNILYVSSSELFSYLPKKKQEEILPAVMKQNAMAITGFTIDTMYEYVVTEKGREMSLHPFKKGIFLGSGPGSEVLKQAGLDVKSQIKAIKSFVKS